MIKAGRLTFNIIRSLPDNRIEERWVHGVVLGILEAMVGNIQYEHEVSEGRIDMRHGGMNPDVIEFVLVRRQGIQWYASQNKTELQKLTRTSRHFAKRRYLLILDPFGPSIPRERMEEDYRSYRETNDEPRGYFGDESVRVVYVHPTLDYHFLWTPPRLTRARTQRRQQLGR
jgi:hypothetical protein